MAVPGGIAVGSIVGVGYAQLLTSLDLLFDPAWAGGSGSPGLIVFGALVGLMVGAGYGCAVGVVTCMTLLVAWLLRTPAWGAAVAGSTAVLTSSVASVLLTVGGDAATLVVPAWASTHGVAGVLLLCWVAEQRPRDYADAMAARTGLRAAGLGDAR